MGSAGRLIGKLTRTGITAAIGLLLIAADEPLPPDPIGDEVTWDEPAGNGYPDPPYAVESRIKGSRFEPGDFAYLRGGFPGASDQENADFEVVWQWVEQCRTQGSARRKAEVARLKVDLYREPTRSGASICEQVILPGGWSITLDSWEDFEAGLPGARLVFNTLIDTIDKTELRLWPKGGDFARELELRALSDQLLRLANAQPVDGETERRVPQLDENESAVLRGLIWSELARVDFSNTVWLRRKIAKSGWPKISEVGEKAANAAWLIAQHADHDPAFQYRALKMIEPLVVQREASAQNYAYLYDRVMLKLEGKQRYATQFWCKDGRFEPRPLEEPDRIDELRNEMGLDPLTEYSQRFGETC